MVAAIPDATLQAYHEWVKSVDGGELIIAPEILAGFDEETQQRLLE